MVDLLDSVRALLCPGLHDPCASHYSLFLPGAICLPGPLHDSSGERGVTGFG